eukprot:COSAG01_NODE_45993_length_404_cov_0.849180_1_plen_104_part_01
MTLLEIVAINQKLCAGAKDSNQWKLETVLDYWKQAKRIPVRRRRLVHTNDILLSPSPPRLLPVAATSSADTSSAATSGFECNRKRNYAYRNYRRNYGVIVTLLI